MLRKTEFCSVFKVKNGPKTAFLDKAMHTSAQKVIGTATFRVMVRMLRKKKIVRKCAISRLFDVFILRSEHFENSDSNLISTVFRKFGVELAFCAHNPKVMCSNPDVSNIFPPLFFPFFCAFYQFSLKNKYFCAKF